MSLFVYAVNSWSFLETKPVPETRLHGSQLLRRKEAKFPNQSCMRNCNQALNVKSAWPQETDLDVYFKPGGPCAGCMRYQGHQGPILIQRRNTHNQAGPNLRSQTKVD